jgi:hypothetical protein
MTHPIRNDAGISVDRLQVFSAFVKRVEPRILRRAAELGKALAMNDVFAFCWQTVGEDLVWVGAAADARDYLVPTLQDVDLTLVAFVQQRLVAKAEVHQLRAVLVGSWGTVGVVLDVLDPGRHGAS